MDGTRSGRPVLWWCLLFPHLPGEVVRFYESSSPLLSSSLLFPFLSSLLLSSPLLVSSTTASSRSQWAIPQLQVHDRSGHYRTSTASARWQLVLPDLRSKRHTAVGTPGPQSPAPDRNRRTSTASARSQWRPDRTEHSWTSTGSSRSQWGLPDLNGQLQIAR